MKESKITVVAWSPKPLVLVRIQALLLYAFLSQLEEETDSKSAQFGFESQVRHIGAVFEDQAKPLKILVPWVL